MQIIRINRTAHIVELLDITVDAFKARGIEINHDQAHCLWDLACWSGGINVYDPEEHDAMVQLLLEHAEVIEKESITLNICDSLIMDESDVQTMINEINSGVDTP